MVVLVLHHPEEAATRQWAGNHPNPPRTVKGMRVTEGALPGAGYPLPVLARRLVDTLHTAGETWELIVHEHDDTVNVRHYRPGEWPVRTDWTWKDGRRTHGTAVRDTLTALADRLETR